MHRGLNGQRLGDEHPAYAPRGTAPLPRRQLLLVGGRRDSV